MDKIEFKKEQEKLQTIIKQYKNVFEDVSLALKSLKKRPMSDPVTYNNLLTTYENKLKVLENGFLKPYFARIDFKSNDEDKKEICYIGKVGVSDYDSNIITVDWRTPIASLYYDNNIGNVSYQAPEGNITGLMDLKRQYEIDNSELISYRDVDTVTNDEILKPYLGVNTDNRLKNIVSSIQDEQNKIIRESMNENIICQGVAGSGKTTVALHRIAYLAYNFRNSINSDQYMVIGPNKFFINYISSVLPELDVTSVPQLTFLEFAQDFLEENIKMNDIGFDRNINNEVNPYAFKMSMFYKELIDSYLRYIDEYCVVPDKDFSFKGISIIPQNVILETYRELDEKYHDSIDSKIERVVLLLSNYIKSNSEKLLSIANKELSALLDKKNISKEKYQKDYALLKRDLESGCVSSLKKHFTIRTKKTTVLYSDFISKYSQFTTRENTDSLKKITFLIKNEFSFEDLPALIYLHTLIHGSKEHKMYKHVVIDEAQDYNVFNFYALKKAMPKATFSIFGDLAQSIYDYRSLDSWDEVKNTVFDKSCNIEYLLKSYRTTIEIMVQANQILDYLKLKASEPVIRHGEDVKYTLFEDNNFLIIKKKLESLKEKKYDSIAIISRTEEEAEFVSNELIKIGLSIEYVNMQDSQYHGGICSVSSQCSKGLEFDAVIIYNVNEQTYSSENNTDLKNLYVAMTRALHSLEILYQQPITKPLERKLYLN